jgi:hypothetical protein
MKIEGLSMTVLFTAVKCNHDPNERNAPLFLLP